MALLGSSALLPEELKRHPIGEYVRYLLIALTGLVAVPTLFRSFWREKPATGPG